MDNQKKEYNKERFQFILFINDNVICQRYFKINGFNEESLNSLELKNVIDEITVGDSNNGLITSDLTSKSRVYCWYNYDDSPIKLNGFSNIYETDYLENNCNTQEENTEEKAEPWEFTFKFSFLVDEKEVCSRIWDGYAYPKFVRDSVDITNKKTLYENEDPNRLPFQISLIRKMTIDKTDLVYKIIEKLCETLSNSYSSSYEYTKTFNSSDKKYELNINSLNRKMYNKLEKLLYRKTKKYMNSLYPSKEECSYYDNVL